MTEDDLLNFMQENKADIIASVKAKAISAMTEQVRWGLSSAVQGVVDEFIKTDVLPAIKQELQDHKGPIIAAAVKGAAEIGEAVAQKIVTTAVERMTGYGGTDVLKALFNVR